MFRLVPLLLLAACAVDKSAAEAVPAPRVPDPVPVPTPAVPAPPATPGQLLLAVGEQAEFGPQSSLRYDKLLADSRCPPGVQCVWAGEVRLMLTLTVAGKAESFELASARDKSRTVQGIEVRLLDFGPCPLGHGAPKLECATLSATPPAPAPP